LIAAVNLAGQTEPAAAQNPSEESPQLCGPGAPGHDATETPAIVDIPAGTYLTISGEGAPGSDAFRQKIGMMYGTVYPLKMKSAMTGRDFRICPLEGLWWGPEDKEVVTDQPPESLKWKLLIRVPEFITDEDVKKVMPPTGGEDGKSAAPEMKIEKLHEGRCVQVLHVGSYSEEGKTIAAMLAFAKEKGLTPHGRHHEIYLSDPNTTPPDKLTTILRQPVK
jgi:hypothetical protein